MQHAKSTKVRLLDAGGHLLRVLEFSPLIRLADLNQLRALGAARLEVLQQ